MKSIYHNRDKKIDEIWANRGKVFGSWLVAITEFADSVTPDSPECCITTRYQMASIAKVLNDGEEVDTSVPTKKLDAILGEFPTNETILEALKECRKVFESFVAVNKAAFCKKMYGLTDFIVDDRAVYEHLDENIQTFGEELNNIIRYYEGNSTTALSTDFID